MEAVTIAKTADGKTKLVHGTDLKPSEQMKLVQQMRNDPAKMPKGAVRVEVWTRQCTKFAVAPKPAAKAAAPDEK